MDSMGKDGYNMFSGPAILETCADLMVTMVPFWMAIVIGLVVGWSWKPRWVSFVVLALRSRPRLVWSTPPGFGARRLWLALTAITAFPFLKEAWSNFHTWMWPDEILHVDDFQCGGASVRSTDVEGNEWALTAEDLVDFYNRVECLDGGFEWNSIMERSTDGMIYQAWRREPLDGVGPTEYRSRTLFDGVSPEEMRDFFWDDEFRSEWDDMLISCKTWEVCPRTGSMVVQWVRKFPVFCKDREYTISRRIWAAGNTYYCVTKGIRYPKVPRQTSPRRVDHYFSSWRIRAVDSHKGDGPFTGCEVMLFHHEDMGIQRDLAKLGIRQGMWGCVKKMQPGLKLYKEVRRQGRPLSKSALMAHVNTKVPPNFAQALVTIDSSKESLRDPSKGDDSFVTEEKSSRVGCLRWFILGGAVALACGVDKGAVGKVLVFGLARRLGKVNKRKRVRY